MEPKLLHKRKHPPAQQSTAPEAPVDRLWIVGLALGAILGGFVLWLFDKNAQYAVCSQLNHIYTVDEANPTVECISVKGSRILDTGSLEKIQSRSVVLPDYPWLSRVLTRVLTIRPNLKVYEVPAGSIVVPGLADAHAHVLEYGWKMQLELDGALSVKEIISRIKTYILAHPDVHNDKSRWIEGMGWDQSLWPGGEFPNATDLSTDPLLSGRPIALSRKDGHASWVSTRVLEIMESANRLPSTVQGGKILRDSDGKPTGIFLDNALSLIPLPAWSSSQLTEYFDRTMKDALSVGLTSIHDADAGSGGGREGNATVREGIEFFLGKARAGKLPIRLYLMAHVPIPSPDSESSSLDAYTHWQTLRMSKLINYGRKGRLNLRSVKLFTDGALGSWGAALLQPYSDNPESNGIMRSSPEVLKSLVRKFEEDGWGVNIHCIGDRANKVVLDIFEEVLSGQNVSTKSTKPKTSNVDVDMHVLEQAFKWRPRIEHAQIMTLQDIERIGRLGVIPSVQPTHATSDMNYAESRLGPLRIKGAYAYQSLLQSSQYNILPLGSDFPVERINPLYGFHAAISRLDVHGESPHGDGGWFPEQRLTRAQALKGMTLDAAFASYAEKDIGSLVPGKKADFVILDRNIMEVDFKDVLETKVKATIVDGVVAYGAL